MHHIHRSSTMSCEVYDMASALQLARGLKRTLQSLLLKLLYLWNAQDRRKNGQIIPKSFPSERVQIVLSFGGSVAECHGPGGSEHRSQGDAPAWPPTQSDSVQACRMPFHKPWRRAEPKTANVNISTSTRSSFSRQNDSQTLSAKSNLRKGAAALLFRVSNWTVRFLSLTRHGEGLSHIHTNQPARCVYSRVAGEGNVKNCYLIDLFCDCQLVLITHRYGVRLQEYSDQQTW